jgi:hypothetical protein
MLLAARKKIAEARIAWEQHDLRACPPDYCCSVSLLTFSLP